MVENIIEEIEEKNTNIFRTNCKYCKKEIKGTSLSQVKYLLLQHKLSQHKNKLEIKEKN